MLELFTPRHAPRRTRTYGIPVIIGKPKVGISGNLGYSRHSQIFLGFANGIFRSSEMDLREDCRCAAAMVCCARFGEAELIEVRFVVFPGRVDCAG
jgi:hypothetical protein